MVSLLWSYKFRFELIDAYRLICLFVKTTPVSLIKFYGFFSKGSAKLSIRLLSQSAKTITNKKFHQFHTSAFERCNCLQILIFISIRFMWALAVLDIGCPVAKLAFSDISCSPLASLEFLNVDQSEKDFVFVHFPAAWTLSSEPPFIIRW